VAALSPEADTPLVGLGDFLFAHTGGQPLYLLETLKLLRERGWLVPRLAADGTWQMEVDVDLAALLAQEPSRRDLLPASVRTMILARLAKLSPAARHLVMAGAVLGTQATAQLLWQVAEVGVQEGLAALEEAVGSGMLREEPAVVGHLGSYRFAYDLIREVVYTELGEARRLVLHQRAFARLSTQGARACELAYHAKASGQVEAAYRYSVQAGDEAVAVFAVEDAIVYYEQARSLLREHKPLQSVLPTAEVEHLYASLGRAYAFLKAWQKAQQAYEELLAYAQQQQLPTLVSLTLNCLAILAAQQSHDKTSTHTLLEEARCMAQDSHDQRALAETEWNQAQITVLVWADPTSALPYGEHALSLARASLDKELEARSLCLLGYIHLLRADFEEAMDCAKASLALYELLGHEQSASWELSAAHFVIASPLTQSLTNRTSEAFCWALLALAQVNSGQVQSSIDSGRRGLELSQEIKNFWAHIFSTHCLTQGLLEAGAYEEALELTQHAMEVARALPPMINFQCLLTALGSTYHALQQGEEAQAALEEAVAVAETLDLRPSRVPTLSRLCMNYAVAGEWEDAYRSALQAVAVRKSYDVALISLDFFRHYETEALLRGGDERLAREEVHRWGQRLGSSPRFRISYLRSLAVLAAWDGQSEQVLAHLHEAAQLAADLGLPAEQWQIQAALGRVSEASGQQAQARRAFGEAARIIQELAEGIGDEALRTKFLAAPPIQQVVQQAQSEASQVPKSLVVLQK